MHKALQPRVDIDNMNQEKKKKGFFSIGNSVDSSIQWFEDNIEKSK